ncbi:hypothetical protein D8674_012754 [Pyrus ussuriensis x Pyrus communis]|uniref:Uncharacterized protein n=1 Tax=Pyrus ussuriensis x Pyrus communis TaxID=2448454 RepID=A0A5N5GMU7_9ROSA|nr:hypothetical protein D8674_012754 [Pyrus ussuriensis x Pyrus communis]
MADSGEGSGKKKLVVRLERYRQKQVSYFEGKSLAEVHWDVDETDEKQQIYVDGLSKQSFWQWKFDVLRTRKD